MSWLLANGIELSGIASIEGAPTGEHRDIGAQHEATDGSLVLTRQVRKRDLKFESVPLSGGDAFSWESLLVGEGHVFSFDNSYYSSKGLGPTSIDTSGFGTTTPSPKYGTHYVEFNVDNSLEYVFGASYDAAWTVSFWSSNANGFSDAGQWHHFVIRSDGAIWENGVRNDSLTYYGVTFGFFTGGHLILQGPDPGPASLDDMVVCPYLWLDDWAAQVYASDYAFGPTPYLTCTGLLVPEAATRTMACVKCDERIMKVNLGNTPAHEPDVRVLSVELKGR